MPIDRAAGRRGSAGVLAMPGRRLGAAWSSLSPTVARSVFRSQPFSTYSPVLSGQTQNSTGVALGGCVVQLFRTVDDAIHAETTSDGSGNYTFLPSITGPFYVVAYKAGAPDVMGTTVNTLVPV